MNASALGCFLALDLRSLLSDIREDTMAVTRRVLVSMPADQWLRPQQNALKWGIVREIETGGYRPKSSSIPRGKSGLTAAKAWGPDVVDAVARRCVGAAVLGFPRWEFRGHFTHRLPTEFDHYEGCSLHCPPSNDGIGPGRCSPDVSCSTTSSTVISVGFRLERPRLAVENT